MTAEKKQTAVTKAEPKKVAVELDQGSAVLGMIEKFMMSDVPVERLDQLFELHRKIEVDRKQMAYQSAFSDAQAEMEPVAKDASNPQTRSKYASHHALDKAIRPIYTRHGFSVSFNTADGAPPAHIRMLGYLSHREGHRETYQADIPCDGKGAKGNAVMTLTHAAGSAFTYGKRYLLGLMWNIAMAETDDDGNGAGGSVETITAEQGIQIEKLIKETKTDKNNFLEWAKIKEIPQLPADKHAIAVKFLENKKKRPGAR